MGSRELGDIAASRRRIPVVAGRKSISSTLVDLRNRCISTDVRVEQKVEPLPNKSQEGPPQPYAAIRWLALRLLLWRLLCALRLFHISKPK